MRKIAIFIALAFLLMLCATPAHANGISALPHAFCGSVTVNGAPAADGTLVSATVDSGDILATQNPVTTAGGSYGVDSPRLLVQGDITPGATITFHVTNANGSATGGTATFEAGGGPTRVDLGVTISRPPSGGSGGRAGRDTTPPTISAISVSNITETSADISWKTDEKSDSQVEYWTSPSKLSPLDETMVYSHLVHLTGLPPGTTYHYKTRSKDAAGNLAVSDVFTFTTQGKAPAAAFSSSDLSISPSEVNIGEEVTISVSVNNTGTASGTYKVTLKIDGSVEDTKEVTLNPGASGEATFSVTKYVAGSYSVEVNGLTGSFEVTELAVTTLPPEEAPPAKPFPWPLIGGIIAAVVVVGLGVFFWVRRRRAA